MGLVQQFGSKILGKKCQVIFLCLSMGEPLEEMVQIAIGLMATSLCSLNEAVEVFGWGKTVGCLRKLRHREIKMVEWIFTFTAAAYKLVRMRNLGVA